jgi:hypothetical protein
MKMKIEDRFPGRELGLRPLPYVLSQDLLGIDPLLLGQDHNQLLLSRIHEPELLNFFHLKVYNISVK